MHRRLAAAVALSAALLLSACTDDAPQPPPPPSGEPTVPSASPTPSRPPTSASPENPKHADLLHIQELYKAEFADETRVLKAGGSNTLPPSIKSRTSGLYRQVVLDSFRSQKKKGQRLVRGGRIRGVAMGKWSPSAVKFQACEDYTRVESVDKNGDKIHSGPGARVIQTYEVLKRHGKWRIDSASGKAVKTFRAAPCDGTWYS